jgi:hypothetical protein
MTLHVEEMISEVTVVGGDVPLTEEQIGHIADVVIARMEHLKRDRRRARVATELRPMSEPPPSGTGVGP